MRGAISARLVGVVLSCGLLEGAASAEEAGRTLYDVYADGWQTSAWSAPVDQWTLRLRCPQTLPVDGGSRTGYVLAEVRNLAAEARDFNILGRVVLVSDAGESELQRWTPNVPMLPARVPAGGAFRWWQSGALMPAGRAVLKVRANGVSSPTLTTTVAAECGPDFSWQADGPTVRLLRQYWEHFPEAQVNTDPDGAVFRRSDPCAAVLPCGSKLVSALRFTIPVQRGHLLWAFSRREGSAMERWYILPRERDMKGFEDFAKGKLVNEVPGIGKAGDGVYFQALPGKLLESKREYAIWLCFAAAPSCDFGYTMNIIPVKSAVGRHVFGKCLNLDKDVSFLTNRDWLGAPDATWPGGYMGYSSMRVESGRVFFIDTEGSDGKP